MGPSLVTVGIEGGYSERSSELPFNRVYTYALVRADLCECRYLLVGMAPSLARVGIAVGYSRRRWFSQCQCMSSRSASSKTLASDINTTALLRAMSWRYQAGGYVLVLFEFIGKCRVGVPGLAIASVPPILGHRYFGSFSRSFLLFIVEIPPR